MLLVNLLSRENIGFDWLDVKALLSSRSQGATKRDVVVVEVAWVVVVFIGSVFFSTQPTSHRRLRGRGRGGGGRGGEGGGVGGGGRGRGGKGGEKERVCVCVCV